MRLLLTNTSVRISEDFSYKGFYSKTLPFPLFDWEIDSTLVDETLEVLRPFIQEQQLKIAKHTLNGDEDLPRKKGKIAIEE